MPTSADFAHLRSRKNRDELRDLWSRTPNQRELVVIAQDELPVYWVTAQVQDGAIKPVDMGSVTEALVSQRYPSDSEEAQRVRMIIEKIIGNTSNADSAVLAARLAYDFGGWGHYRIQKYNGRAYYIFEGNHRLRSIVTGTRYRLDNPRLISLGIGKMGLRSSVTSGLRLTVVLVGAYRIAEFLLRDEATLTYFLGHLASDVVKAGAAALASFGAAMTAAHVATAVGAAVVVGPLVVAIAVGVLVGVSLDAIDAKYGLTDKLVAQLDRLLAEASDKQATFFADFDRALYRFFVCSKSYTSMNALPQCR